MNRVGTTAVLDVQRILAESKYGHLIREVIEGAGKEYEADLQMCVGVDIAKLIQTAGESGAFPLIVERQRAGVLYASADVDITPVILEAYDAKYDRTMAQCDRDAMIRQYKDLFAAVTKDREAREPSTGVYL